MKGCIFITDSDCEHGFALAGFKQILADRDTVLGILKQIVIDETPGIVFVDERILTENIMGRFRLLEKQWGGAFILLPAPGEGDEAIKRDTGRQFISRVLGYQMKLS